MPTLDFSIKLKRNIALVYGQNILYEKTFWPIKKVLKSFVCLILSAKNETNQTCSRCNVTLTHSCMLLII